MEEHRVFEIPQLKEAGDMKDRRNFRDLPPTYIPMRNGIFYSVAASYAEEVGADYIIGQAAKKRMFEPSNGWRYWRKLESVETA